MSGGARAPLPGRIVGYAVMIVVVAGAARVVWELLAPMVPVLSGLVVLAALGWWLLGGRRR
ncbi:MAG: hypothetical protein LC775_20565 [Acidobacteria bacterium]|nr:hypothetical protein [Acidobacteriota bacterium]